MANMRNQVRLIGRLGKDPDVKETTTGKKLARLNLATNESYLNDKGERVSETQWHAVICWGRLATLAEKYLAKGNELAIEGKINNRSYQDKDGSRKFITEIVASDFVMLGKRSAEAA